MPSLHPFTAIALGFLAAAAALASPASLPRRSATADPLAGWLGAAYARLNALRVTSPADTPLRLRSALNSIAQAHADTLCSAAAANPADSADAADAVQMLADQGIIVDNGAEMHSVGGQATAEDAVAAWGRQTPGALSAWSAIVYPAYVYVGLGRCNDSWVVVVASEFL